MIYRDLLNKATKKLIENNKEESVAIYLLEHVTGFNNPTLYTKLEEVAEDNISNEFYRLLDIHIKDNKPVQYITNKAPFYGYEYFVNENVLIPRFDTETLVENILYYYDTYFSPSKVKVVDVGTGSGCVGITLSLEESNMDVTITDISSDALDVAKRNINKYGAKVNVLCGDMLKPLINQKFDILVSNPPYIPNDEDVMSLVKDNEPHLALFGGDDGLKFYRIIVEESKNILNDKFLLAFEHAYDKSVEIHNLIKQHYPNAFIKTFKDMQGKDRATLALQGFKDEI